MKHALTKRAAILAFALATLAAGHARSEEMVIEGVQLSRDFECDGHDVVVGGQGNTIKLLGTCGDVRVIGSDHKIEFENLKSLSVVGVKIALTGGKVGALALDVSENTVKATVGAADGPAEVRIFGADQKSELRFASAAVVTVGGASNALTYDTDKGVKAPTISALGVDLKIARKK